MSVDDRLVPAGIFWLRIALGTMYLSHSVVLVAGRPRPALARTAPGLPS